MIHEQYINTITDGLTFLSIKLKALNSCNLTSINIHSEYFFRDFLNLLLDLKLVNTSSLKQNAPAIDLEDEEKKICFQVTSDNSLGKTRKTLKTFENHMLYRKYNRLIIIQLVDKTKHKKVNTQYLKFDKSNDIWGIQDLIRKCMDSELERLKNISNLVKDTIFNNNIDPFVVSDQNNKKLLNLKDSIDEADSLYEMTCYKDALAKYENILKGELSSIDNPLIYADIKNSIGVILWRLALIESKDKERYLKKSLIAYEEALSIYAKEESTLDSAMVLNNFANSYVDLSLVRNKAEYINKAVQAYEKNIIIYKENSCFEEFAMTMNNIGTAFLELAKCDNAKDNILKSTKAFLSALEIRKADKNATDYATTKNNLGTAYLALADIQDSEKNLEKAILVFKDALRFRSVESCSEDYAITMNNLGIAYSLLSKVKDSDKAQNIEIAIESFEDVLQVWTLERNPVDYAKTKHNLGNVLLELSNIKGNSDIISRAISEFEDALNVINIVDYPLDHTTTKVSLGVAYRKLANEMLSFPYNSTDYFKDAIKSFKQALKVKTKDNYPYEYGIIQSNIGDYYFFLSSAENNEEYLLSAIEAFTMALAVFDYKSYPNIFDKIIRKMEIAEELLGFK